MSFPHNFLLGCNALIIPLQSGFRYTYRVVRPSPPPLFRHLYLSWVSRVSGSWDFVKEMLFVANLSHFISCRKVHILGSFQNIKMARTAICNLILGNSNFFLCCFLWKKRTGNLGTQITFAGHFRVRVMIKVASRNSWGLANVGPERKQEYFCLDSICKPERKGLLDYIGYIVAASPDEVR